MKKLFYNIRKMTSKIPARVLAQAGAFALMIGTLAVTRCVVPVWYNEPEMPKSMLED